jgi:hypothetical protein
MAGTRGQLGVVDSDVSPRRDSVARLHRFQGDHTEVQLRSARSSSRAPTCAA